MIDVQTAVRLIEAHAQYRVAQVLPLTEAAGLVTAAPVYAPCDIPAFQQSSMDGYAFAFADWEKTGRLRVHGHIPAGAPAGVLESGAAARIFTGAPLPTGADTVIEQEKVMLTDGWLTIDAADLQPARHTRPQGAEVQAGAMALPEGILLSPAALGYLAMLGLAEVPVWAPPKVQIILTGNELQAPGSPLLPGQVYEANSGAMVALLRQWGIRDIQTAIVPDDLDALTLAIRQALEQCDWLLLTGGVSVGDYDFVPAAAAANGVETIFHKIKQKPGKPMFFGQKESKLVFGLPGNPGSVLTCMYRYVSVAMTQRSGRDVVPKAIQAPLSADFQKPAGLTHFLKGHYDGDKIIVQPGQESYRLRSFAQANCLVILDESVTSVTAGTIVTGMQI